MITGQGRGSGAALPSGTNRGALSARIVAVSVAFRLATRGSAIHARTSVSRLM